VPGLDRDEYTFLEELDYEKYKKLGKTELLAKFTKLEKKYKKLLKQMVKITRIGDANQKKLQAANEKIEKQKQEVEASRDALTLELSHAAEYIISLIPQPITEGPVRTDWRFFPSRELGGDCLGFHWIDPDHFAMYLLDVCNHGVRPALLSVSVNDVLRSQSLHNTDFKDPANVLEELNRIYQMKKFNNLFFTIWYGVYQTGTRILRYTSAGHPPALLFQSSDNHTNKPVELRTRHLVIGGSMDTQYRTREVLIDKGAILYIFSDGAFEVEGPGDTLWTLGQLQDYLQHMLSESGNELDQLYGFLKERLGDNMLQDDFSILKIQFQ
jgi:sigma-B regulation protein RsbU (phosphoserine phosphatase)